MVRMGISILVVFMCLGVRAANPLDSVRLYAIEPACFDYTFTAIVSASSTNPVLSFNHRGGRTYFVHPGERLGDYVVRDFRPVTTKVFNPSIKLVQEQKSGSVTLQATNGPALVLELGRRLAQPGWMAYLVNLADGNWWTVKETDTIVSGSESIQIGSVASNSVTAVAMGVTNQVPLITDGEAKKLTALWNSRARSRAEDNLALESAKPEDDSLFDPVPPAPRQDQTSRRSAQTVVMQYPSRTFFGTDYSYPTEYMVLPAIWSSSGNQIRPTIIVPRRFETRSSGFSMEAR